MAQPPPPPDTPPDQPDRQPPRPRRPIWPWLVLAGAAILGIVVGTLLGLRNTSLLAGEPGQALGRPTITIASPLAAPATRVPSPSPVAPTPQPSQPAEVAQTYVVQPGDSMRSIAQQLYGDPALWPRIYDANRDVIGPNPDALQPGMQLRIPPAS